MSGYIKGYFQFYNGARFRTSYLNAFADTCGVDMDIIYDLVNNLLETEHFDFPSCTLESGLEVHRFSLRDAKRILNKLTAIQFPHDQERYLERFLEVNDNVSRLITIFGEETALLGPLEVNLIAGT